MKCPECNGTGMVEVMLSGGQGWDEEEGTIIQDDQFFERKCDMCSGSGEVEEEGKANDIIERQRTFES